MRHWIINMLFMKVYKREAMCDPRLCTSGAERVHMLLIKI